MTGVDLEVLEELRRLPLEHLAHFTPARNLRHVLADGEIRSAAALRQDSRACYTPTDLERLDKNPDKVCCSFQYPNAYYLGVARTKSIAWNYPDWVCLLIDKEAAARTGTLFSARNAAAGGAKPGVAGLRACFAQRTGYGDRAVWRGPNHDPRCATDVQAEALVPGPIALAAIRAVVFPADDAAVEEYGRMERIGVDIAVGPRWRVSAEMFDKAATVDAIRNSRSFEVRPWGGPLV